MICMKLWKQKKTDKLNSCTYSKQLYLKMKKSEEISGIQVLIPRVS